MHARECIGFPEHAQAERGAPGARRAGWAPGRHQKQLVQHGKASYALSLRADGGRRRARGRRAGRTQARQGARLTAACCARR